MKHILAKDKPEPNKAFAQKVKQSCMQYAAEAHTIDKSKTLTEWYQFFLTAMRDKYRKSKLSKEISTVSVDK